MNSYLTFKIGKESFAAGIENVLEIIGVPEFTTLPNAPDHVLGVINHRGKVLVTVDPRLKFGITSVLPKSNPCIIILENKTEENTHELGILVDMAESVIELNEKEILPPPSLGASLKEDIITGVIKRDNEFIMILNIENVFSKEFNLNK